MRAHVCAMLNAVERFRTMDCGAGRRMPPVQDPAAGPSSAGQSHAPIPIAIAAQAPAALVVTRLSETVLASIALSVFVSNLFGAIPRFFFLLFVADSPDGSTSWHFIEFPEDGE